MENRQREREEVVERQDLCEGRESAGDEAAAMSPAIPSSAAGSASGSLHPVAEVVEPLEDVGPTQDVAAIIERIGDARLVLIGEATHGTSEFYRMRAHLTRELITKRGFGAVAIEADWPDAARIDAYVRHLDASAADWTAFSRFPRWMWRNREVRDFVDWLRDFNRSVGNPNDRVGVYGLDMYSMYTSIEAVLRYLDDIDPEAARTARERYGCLTPYQEDPAVYGKAALTGRHRECEPEVVEMLGDLLEKRLQYAARDGARFLDAVANARLVANAERYYRVMYYGAVPSWNLRDQHMFDTIDAVLAHHGPEGRIVVWEHNSHVGDASATEMAIRGEHNVGQLCRARFGRDAYLIGFGTDHGTVAAASHWGGAMQLKRIRPSHERSYERLCHDSGIARFTVGFRGNTDACRVFETPRLQRAIGVIYRPETELASHYYEARLPAQFDEYIWLDETSAVTPLETAELAGVPDTYPFGE